MRNFIGKFGKYALLSVDDFDKSKDWFNKYDEWVIFFSRMVPIVRSLISIPAGVAGMNLPKFSIYTILGTALWSFILSYAGRLLGEQWPVITDFINTYQNVVLAVALVVVVVFVVYRLLHKRKTAD